jgi:hypothetical protein
MSCKILNKIRLFPLKALNLNLGMAKYFACWKVETDFAIITYVYVCMYVRIYVGIYVLCKEGAVGTEYLKRLKSVYRSELLGFWTLSIARNKK